MSAPHTSIDPTTAVARARTAPVRSVRHHVLSTQLPGIWWLFGFYLLAVAVIGVAIHLFAGISGSIWSGALQPPRWALLGWSASLAASQLPVYVAHGRTRRETITALQSFVVVSAVAVGALVVLGFAVESGVYRLLGWSDLLDDTHAARSLAALGVAWVDQSLRLGVWAALGLVGGVAFYRGNGLGAAVIPLGLLAIGATETTAVVPRSGSLPPFLERLGDVAPPVGIGIPLVIIVLALLATRQVARDVPLRPRTT